MTSLDIIKSKIQKLYKTNPNIHINVAITHPKVNLKNEPVVIELLKWKHCFLSGFPPIYQCSPK